MLITQKVKSKICTNKYLIYPRGRIIQFIEAFILKKQFQKTTSAPDQRKQLTRHRS